MFRIPRAGSMIRPIVPAGDARARLARVSPGPATSTIGGHIGARAHLFIVVGRPRYGRPAPSAGARNQQRGGDPPHGANFLPPPRFGRGRCSAPYLPNPTGFDYDVRMRPPGKAPVGPALMKRTEKKHTAVADSWLRNGRVRNLLGGKSRNAKAGQFDIRLHPLRPKQLRLCQHGLDGCFLQVR